MKVKDQVLKQLEDNKGTYFSGSELAAALGVSRNAVWKAIKSLEKSGYRISAVPNKGYCLNMDNDILSSWSIKQHLNHDGLNITVYDTISSTNDVLKEQAAQGAPHGTVIISQEQTAGKGRMGKNFYSPSKTGIYLSILVRPDIPARESLFLTTSAAVATATVITRRSCSHFSLLPLSLSLLAALIAAARCYRCRYSRSATSIFLLLTLFSLL